jgi:hypothetical protein
MAEHDAVPARRRAIVIAEYPDVCRAPKVPAPFQTVAYLSDAQGVSPNVRIHGYPATNERTTIPVIHGSPPFKGIKSGTVNGPCYPLGNTSPTLRVNRAPIVRDGTVFAINSTGLAGQFNTRGPVIYLRGGGGGFIDANGNLHGEMSPPLSLTDVKSIEQLQAWGRQTKAMTQAAMSDLAKAAAELNEKYRVGTRALGAVQTVGGGAEAFVGGACVYFSAGLGAVLGCGAIAVHGADNVQAGARTAWSGESVPTFTHEIVRGAALNAGYSEGVSAGMAMGVDTGIGLLTPAGATKLAKSLEVLDNVPPPPPRVPAPGGRAPAPPAPRGPQAPRTTSTTSGNTAQGAAAGTNGAKVGLRPASQVFSEADVNPNQLWNKQTWRADSRSPEELRKAGGFQGTDPNARISAETHMLKDRPASQWVSTTQSPDVAEGYVLQNQIRDNFENAQYIYQINAPGGINLNTVPGILNTSNLEVAFSSGIPWSSVTGYWTIVYDPKTHQVIRTWTSLL